MPSTGANFPLPQAPSELLQNVLVALCATMAVRQVNVSVLKNSQVRRRSQSVQHIYANLPVI
jgi:hypothetical protein